MAPGAAAATRAPQAGSTGSSAARWRLPHPRGRSDGHRARRHSERPRPGFQTGSPGSSSIRPPHLRAARRASAGTDGTCASSVPGLRPSPPGAGPGRAPGRAGLREPRGSWVLCLRRRPGRAQVEQPRLRGAPSQVPPRPGDRAVRAREEPQPARHHEQQQRQHHLCQSEAAEAGAENVSLRGESSVRWRVGAQARGAGRCRPRPQIPGAGD